MEENKFFQNLKKTQGGYLVNNEAYRMQELAYAENVILMTPKFSLCEKLVCIKYRGGYKLLFGFITKGEDPIYIKSDGSLLEEPIGAILRSVVKKHLSNPGFKPNNLPSIKIKGPKKVRRRSSVKTKNWMQDVFVSALEELGLKHMIRIQI